jgi:hypothetical protein
MRSRKSLVSTLTAAAVLGTGLIGMATPAQAAPGKAAPRCVKTQTYNTASAFTVQVRNTCKSSVKVKVVMRLGKDSPCKTIKKGQYYYWTNKNLGTWKATVKC